MGYRSQIQRSKDVECKGTIMMTLGRVFGLAAALVFVSACGGGGGGDGGSGGGTQPTSFTVSTSTTGTGSGTISPTSRSVAQGSTTSFTISPGSGSSIGSVSGCGGSLSGSTYTTGPINGNCTVSATFDLNTYTVTATAGTGGSITPTSATVNHGSTASFTVTPATGYTIDSVSGCGGSLSGNTFTTAAITGDCSVSASFRASGTTPPPPVGSFTVTTTTTGTGSGTISPTQAVIPQGQTATFQVVPSTGSTIASVTGCGGSLSGSTYTTGAINSNCVVTASFTLNTYTVTATAGEGGSVSPESVTVNHGATVTLIATPDVDYGFASWTEGGATVSTSGTYTFTATSNRSLVANFRLNTELLNGRYDGVMKAPAPISVFDVDKAYTTFEITGRSIQIVQEHFYGETCIFVGEISETSVPLHAFGTYQCSDFTTGTWSSTKIAKTAPDAFIAELEISGGRGDYVAKYNGFLGRADVPDYYAELDPYFYDSGNVDDISGSYIGTLKSGEACAAHSFEISPADVEIVIQGSSIEITQDAFFEGTCIFTGNIADRSRVPLAASGDYMCSNFDVGTWSSDYIVLTGTDSFIAKLAVNVPARGCTYKVAYSGFSAHEVPAGIPIADAGSDEYVVTGTAFTRDARPFFLDGRGSRDAAGNTSTLTFAWNLLIKPPASSAAILDPNSATPTFIPDVEGIFEFELVVNDGLTDSYPALVKVDSRSPGEVWESEYNDEREFANKFHIFDIIHGSLASSSDVDWFTLDVNSQMMVKVMFDPPPVTLGFWSVYWFDKDMNVLSGRNIDAAGGVFQYEFPAFNPGPYYLRVRATEPVFYSGGGYRITVESASP
jgi:hypothetical protein